MGQRCCLQLPPEQIVQPQASESKDAFVPPVVPVEAISLPLLQAGCRQMTDPPPPQAEHQQQALQPSTVSNHGALAVPAPPFAVLERGLHPHSASVLAHALASGRLVREQEPGFLLAWLPDGPDERCQVVFLPNERWAEPGLAQAADQIGQSMPAPSALSAAGSAGGLASLPDTF
jgi:hypothetical protein